MRKLAFVLLFAPVLASADLHYTLSPIPASTTIAVSITDDQPQATETYRIPAWCPGFYFIQKYQDKIFDVSASSPSGALTVDHDGRAWTIQNPKKEPATITYKVLGDDAGLGFFGVNVKTDKAFVNGAAGFMYKDGELTQPIDLTIKLPKGWDIATGMEKGDDGKWHAKGYDEFIDMPIQLGIMKHTGFKVGDLDFDVAWVSASNDYKPKLAEQTEVLRKVSAQTVSLYGGAPFKRYQYLLHLTGAGFLGGLEHRASTCIAMPNTSDLDLSTLAAHEFFHTWNVKNIRPKVLGPFDYTKEVRTGNLWFAEGVTDYYAYIDTYRAGLGGVDWLYGVLASQVSQLQQSQARKQITLEDACKKTWESGGFGYKDLDYYNKGLLSGWVFDASIRGATNGSKSLDDVMRAMYAKYRLPNPGYEEDGIRQMINEVSGKDLSDVYNQAIRSTDELPYAKVEQIGLRLVPPRTRYLDGGFVTLANKITSVNARASDEGLMIGDTVLGMTSSNGASATLLIERNGSQFPLKVEFGSLISDRWIVDENPIASRQQRANLSQWLQR